MESPFPFRSILSAPFSVLTNHYPFCWSTGIVRTIVLRTGTVPTFSQPVQPHVCKTGPVKSRCPGESRQVQQYGCLFKIVAEPAKETDEITTKSCKNFDVFRFRCAVLLLLCCVPLRSATAMSRQIRQTAMTNRT